MYIQIPVYKPVLSYKHTLLVSTSIHKKTTLAYKDDGIQSL